MPIVTIGAAILADGTSVTTTIAGATMQLAAAPHHIITDADIAAQDNRERLRHTHTPAPGHTMGMPMDH